MDNLILPLEKENGVHGDQSHPVILYRHAKSVANNMWSNSNKISDDDLRKLDG
jgi:hypothetical protein